MRRAAFARPRAALLLACALAAGAAGAHDSWLARIDPAQGGGAQFAFTTGALYPLAQSSPPPDSVARAACMDAQGRTRALRAQARGATLVLRGAQALPGDAALGCFAELRAFDITLTPQLVEVYLREIRPPASARARWDRLREEGIAWQERYRKFARIESARADTPPQVLRAIRQPAGLPLEIVPLGDAPLRAGETASFQVLSEGRPVAGLAVELRSERSPLGIWGTSDDAGRLRFTMPFGGAWLLRSTLLEPDTASRGWHSRFATLAFTAH